MKTLLDLIAGSSLPVSVSVTSAILAEAANQVQADQQKRLVDSVKGLLEGFSADLSHQVSTLREYRKQAETQSVRVKEIDRAFRYFAATGNPLPMFVAQNGTILSKSSFNRKANEWCQRAGVEVPNADDEAWKVPADWKPETPAVES